MTELRVKFDSHGLGDCVHFAHLLQLYKRRGHQITVQAEANKQFVWQVAGVEIASQKGFPNHEWRYPSEFEDLSAPDWLGNKIANGINCPPLPILGKKSDLWSELCDVRLRARDFISFEAHEEALSFIRGLPRPIFCLHSRGTNWQQRKSLAIETDFNLILELLDRTSGSVVVLDFDRRAPMVGDARCKGIKPSWGHIGIDRLCALYELADLMIGVDSGPFHVAALTDVKALGVFREIHPVRCCLPSPNASYLVSGRLHRYWAERKSAWNFMEYLGPEPTAFEIADAAIARLAGHKESSAGSTDEVAAIAGTYLYRRVDHDERMIVLNADLSVGEGRGAAEQQWNLRRTGEKSTLSLTGQHGVICKLTQCEKDGVWRGKWSQFEQMEIELIPRPELAPGKRVTVPRHNGFFFLSTNQYLQDVKEFSRELPAIRAVAGIPRSGMVAAAALALERNVPLIPIEELFGSETLPPLSLRRRDIPLPEDGCILVMDDTVATGTRLSVTKPRVRLPVKWAAVYATWVARQEVDFYYALLPDVHQCYEWTLFHDDHTPHMIVDLDGVLCEDWKGISEEEDGSEEYQRFLESARPLRIPTHPLLGIVSNRLEKHRKVTKKWLQRHGVRYEFLELAQFVDAKKRDRVGDVARRKAVAYIKRPEARLFVESDAGLAKAIHDLAGRPVLCYSTMRLVDG